MRGWAGARRHAELSCLTGRSRSSAKRRRKRSAKRAPSRPSCPARCRPKSTGWLRHSLRPALPLCSLPLPPRPLPFPSARRRVPFGDLRRSRAAPPVQSARAHRRVTGPTGLCRAGGLEQFCGSEKAKEGYFQSFCDGVMSASVEEELASQVSLAVRAVACDVEPAAQTAQRAKMKHAACSAGTPSPFGSSMPCFTCRVSEGPSAVLGK